MSLIRLPNSNSVRMCFGLLWNVLALKLTKLKILLVIFLAVFLTSFAIFFGFLDRIFREESKTAEVYNARTKDIVAAAVRGFNGIFLFYLFVLFYLRNCRCLVSRKNSFYLQVVTCWPWHNVLNFQYWDPE